MRRHYSEAPFLVGLISLFFLSALMIIMLSAKSYTSISKDLKSNQNLRTSLAYIEEKVRQMDEDGAIRVGTITDKKGDKLNALIISQVIDGSSFLTYIYAYDGYLREYFLRADYEAYSEDGNPITALQDLKIENVKVPNGEKLISIELVNHEDKWKTYIHPATESQRKQEVDP